MSNETLNRLINVLEPILSYILVILILWLISAEIIIDNSIYIVAGLLILWILFISPIIHYHVLHERTQDGTKFTDYYSLSRGYGNYRAYFGKNTSRQFHFIENWSIIRDLTIVIDILLVGAVFGLEGDVTDFIEDLFGNLDLFTQIGATLILIAVIDVLLVFLLFPILLRLNSSKQAWKEGLLRNIIYNIIIYAIFAIIIGIFWTNLVAVLGVEELNGFQGSNPLALLVSINFMKILGYWGEFLFPCWLILLIVLGTFQMQLSRGLITLDSKKSRIIFVDIATSLMFAGLHLPNIWLFAIMGMAGYFISKWYRKTPNLMIVALSYSFLLSLIYNLLPIFFNISYFII